MAKTYTLNVAGLTRELTICKVNDHMDIAAFIMLGDAELDDYLNRLSRRLATASPDPAQHYTLFAIDDGQINAFVTVDREKTLAMARAADARIAAGTAGPLTGIPVAQKDIFCAEGWTTTCGSKMLANFVSPYDATVIRKMHSEAGMVMVNLPTAGVDYHVPFGGRKGSSYGPREQGAYAKEFYTTVKTAYTLA